MEYEVRDEQGKIEAETRTEIKEVRNQGKATVAEVHASIHATSFGGMEYQMKYVCEGDKIYMDMGAMMKAMMENNPDLKDQEKEVQEAISDVEIDYESSFASFPKRMHTGMKLDDLNFSFKTEATSSEMSFQTNISERQVIAKEKITTKAGTFECLKIRSVSNTVLRVMGFDQTMPQTTEYLWIAPGVGMVKQESHTKGSLTSSMQLTLLKGLRP